MLAETLMAFVALAGSTVAVAATTDAWDAARALPDGTPVIISGGFADGTTRVWRLADGTQVGEPLHGDDDAVFAVAVGALPDGTPVIVSGGFDGRVRVWSLADGTPVGEPLHGHDSAVFAVATGALPDGTPVIVSGGEDGRVRVWRLADGTPLMPPLGLSESVRGVVVNGDIIVTAAGPTSPATSECSCDRCASYCSISRVSDRSAERSDNGRLSGTSASESLPRTSAVTESEHLAERNNRTFGA